MFYYNFYIIELNTSNESMGVAGVNSKEDSRIHIKSESSVIMMVMPEQF
jgi:hypothetical protein